MCGQLARALVIFNIDEVIIFDEGGKDRITGGGGKGTTEGEYKSVGNKKSSEKDPNVFLARVLQYLETPQYLRKSFFPKHKDLQYAGILNPLDCPHHMRIDDEVDFREGVVLNRPVKGDGLSGILL